MQYVDATLPSPQENLAFDEALLDLCEAGNDDVLRVWEPREHCVVLGYSSRMCEEVNLASCRARAIPILRRCSGGGTVLQGPGCLNFSLVLQIREPGPLAGIRTTTAYVLTAHQQALAPLIGSAITLQGSSDLTMGGLKFSGNAQRRRRHAVLVHGTFLLGLDLRLMEEVLPLPSREPAYRQQRPHRRFLTSLPLASEDLKAALRRWVMKAAASSRATLS